MLQRLQVCPSSEQEHPLVEGSAGQEWAGGLRTSWAATSSPASAASLFWVGQWVDHRALHVGDRRPSAVLMDSAGCTPVRDSSCRKMEKL